MSDSDTAIILPGWKRTLWHEISQAAQAKNAFHQENYDEHGDINIRLDKLKEFSIWLSRRSESQLHTFRQTWRCTTDGRWELAFRSIRSTTDEPTIDRAPGPSRESRKRVVRKTTGIKVAGLAPRSQPIQEEWEVLRSDNIPGHDDLSGDTIFVGEKRCNMM